MQAFDRLAPAYDETFSRSVIGQLSACAGAAAAGSAFSGRATRCWNWAAAPGKMRCHLAQRGVQVTATDSSDAMLAITRSKTVGNPLLRVIRRWIWADNRCSTMSRLFDGASPISDR